jgi:ribonuclease HII
MVPLFPLPPRGDRLAFERELLGRGYRLIAGVDEAGRGPLAGPVVAAAVILPLERIIGELAGGGQGDKSPWRGVDDSKRLDASERERLEGFIQAEAVGVGVAQIEAPEIDATDILSASLLAMRRAVEALAPKPDFLIVDGKFRVPLVPVSQRAAPKADHTSLSVAAASIMAKVHRDRLMAEHHQRYPDYNFSSHKGYATAEHLEAIRRLGCCPIHRKSFRGVLEPKGPALPAPANEGREAEDQAARHLELLGYEVVCRNFRTKRGEIDIVCREGNVYVFAEVKARGFSGDLFGGPKAAVDSAKQRRLTLAAQEYMRERGLIGVSARFDVVAISGTGRRQRVEVIRNAFEPPEEE